jgi:TP901 family phage tail tape measure protein
MSRTYELSFKLGAQMAGNFAKTMTSASGTLSTLNSKIADINKQSSSLKSLTDLRGKVAETSRAYIQASQNVAKLGRELSETESPTKEQIRNFEKAKKEVSQTKDRLNSQRESLRRLNTEMGTSSTSTKELTKRQSQLAAASEKAKAAQMSLNKTMAAQEENMSKRSEMRGQLFDAAGLAVALAAPVKIAAQFEQSMAKVGAVSGATDAQIAKLTATARDLGATTAWSASQAAEGMQFLSMAGFNTQQTIAAMPGMLNLASAGATDLGSAADIASNILTGFNLKAEEMGRLGDVMVNTFTTSNTNLSMLGETMKYVAPVAASTGVSLEQAAAMAAKLGDAGIQGSNAGTALRTVISRLSAPTSAASQALNKLGIETQDANGNLRDVPTILSEMNQSMASLGTAARAEMTSTIFGLEAASGATVLLGQAGSGALQQYTDTLYKTGSASRVAAKQNDNAMGAIKRLSSAAESIAITMGNVLLPTLARGAEYVASLVGVVDKLAQQFPVVTTVIVGATAAMIAMRVATIAGGYAFTFVRGAVLQVTKVIQMGRTAWLLYTGAMAASNTTSKAAIVVSKAMTAAQWLFNAALRANPIGLVITAITALIAAGVALYKNWDTVSAYAQKAWGAMKSFGLSALNGLKNAFINFTPIGWLMQAFGAAEGWLSNFSLYDSGKKILQTLGQGILSAAGSVIGSVKSVFNRVREYLPFSDAKVGPFSELTKSGSAIMGTLAEGVNSNQDLESSMNSQMANAGASGIGGFSRSASSSQSSMQSGSNESISLTIENINIGDAGNKSESQIRKAVSDGGKDIVKQIQEAQSRQRRLSYG